MTNLEKLRELIKLDCLKDEQLIELLNQYKLKSDAEYKAKDELKLLKIALQVLDNLSQHIELENEIKVVVDRIRELESENVFTKVRKLISR